jgi:hypothetical protein
MKLRIQGNSLRLRVTQKEVAQLCDSGRVESSIELSPERPLGYTLEQSFDAKTVTARFDGRIVRVSIPAHTLAEWADSDQVGIESRSQAGVQLLIEKDFQGFSVPA